MGRGSNKGGLLSTSSPPCRLVEMAGIEPASREFGTGICYKLSRPFVLARATSTDGVCSGPAESVFDTPYRRRECRTPISVSPDPNPSGLGPVGRGRFRRPWHMQVRHLFLTPLFYEVRAPRLAIPAPPSPSKPFIPMWYLNYSIPLGFWQLTSRLSSARPGRAPPPAGPRARRWPGACRKASCPGPGRSPPWPTCCP